MLVLKFEDDKFNGLFRYGIFVKYTMVQYPSQFLTMASDEVARNGFHHFQLLQGFFLATDKELGVVGLWQPPGIN